MSTTKMGSQGFKWFLGVVEDLEDPLKLGRMRVRVFQEHDEQIDTKALQWAIAVMPVTSASLTGVGVSPTGMAVGSYVVGFYLDGDEKQFPMIVGTWHKIPDMDDSKHDVSALAREKQIITKTPLGPEPASAYAAKYPFNIVTQTASGHTIEMDDTPGQERLHVYHKSGSYVEINKDGRIVTKSADEMLTIVTKDDTVYVKGNGKVTIEGNNSITVNGNASLTVGGNLTSTVKGKATVSVTGNLSATVKGSADVKSTGNMNVTSSKNVNIKGSRINLN